MRQLNQAEEAFTIVNSIYPFTLVCTLRLSSSPSVKALNFALQDLQDIHPLLSVYIQENKGHYRFEKDKQVKPIPLQVIERNTDIQWQELARMELNKAFDHTKSPLMRAIFLCSPSGKEDSEIILSFHHAIIDAASFLPMVHKLLDLIGKDKKEESTNISGKLKAIESSPLLKDVLPPGFKGPRLLFKLLPFMAAQMKEEITYKKASKTIKDSPIPTSSENGLLQIDFSKEETEALVKWTRSQRLTLNSTITAAMLNTINEHKYGGKKVVLRAVQFANLRPYLNPPVSEDGAGCFIAMMRYPARLSPENDIPGLAAYLDQQFRKSAKKGDKFLYALLSKMLVKSTIKAHNARLGAVALSYAGPIPLKEQYGETHLKNIHAYISNNCLGAELSAFGKICFGKLSIDFNYLIEETSREDASIMADEIKSNLLQCIKGL